MLRRLVLDDGIIPAYAGNTTNAFRHIRDHRDHPRVCGEHALLHALMNHVRGSSPRMRGTPTAVVVCHLVRGIIPAYAGNTIQLILCFPPCRDHPRVCGEHQVRDTLYGTTQGSSPRMRGTPVLYESRTLRSGIIPAYAGNTNFRNAFTLPERDHPRVCGEHTKRINHNGTTVL